MRDIHKQRIIQTAIREYKESVLFGFSPSAPHAINMMEKALHMCRPYNVLGISVLENSLKEAKKNTKKNYPGLTNWMFDFRIDRCVGNGREITAPAWIIGHLSIGRSNKSVVLVKKAIPNGTLKKLDNIYNKGEKHDQKRRQT